MGLAGARRREGRVVFVWLYVLLCGLVWVRSDAFKDGKGFEWALEAHAFGRYGEGLAVVRDPVRPSSEHLPVNLRARLNGERVRHGPVSHGARMDARDRASV